jgi:DNA-binding transcriptional MerR regulator
MPEKNKITTLSELALKMQINKSKLNYYYLMGIIEPMTLRGRTMLFDENKTVEKMEKVKKLQSEGKTTKEIVNILDK